MVVSGDWDGVSLSSDISSVASNLGIDAMATNASPRSCVDSVFFAAFVSVMIARLWCESDSSAFSVNAPNTRAAAHLTLCDVSCSSSSIDNVASSISELPAMVSRHAIRTSGD